MLSAVLDIIFPPVCPLCEEDVTEDVLCHGCMEKFSMQRINGSQCDVCAIPFAAASPVQHTCGACLLEPPPYIEARSAFLYGGAALDAVHAFKYNGKTALGPSLGALTARAASFSSACDVVVPVPLHIKRLRHRGFNQSLLLGRVVAKHLKINADASNLKRIRHTEPQINLKHAERAKNISGAFEATRPHELKGKRVLLVDDVFTTGATIRECSKVLKKAGADVYVVTLARAAKM